MLFLYYPLDIQQCYRQRKWTHLCKYYNLTSSLWVIYIASLADVPNTHAFRIVAISWGESNVNIGHFPTSIVTLLELWICYIICHLKWSHSILWKKRESIFIQVWIKSISVVGSFMGVMMILGHAPNVIRQVVQRGRRK